MGGGPFWSDNPKLDVSCFMQLLKKEAWEKKKRKERKQVIHYLITFLLSFYFT